MSRNINRRRIVANGRIVSMNYERDTLDSLKNLKIIKEINTISKDIIRNGLGQNPELKISYCTTCYNRFWQLSKIVKYNLEQVKGDANIEFVIVDFGGKDSEQIFEFLTTDFSNELSTGRIKYYRRKKNIKPFKWNVAIAKNVPHRFATGDIVVNLDGDNFLQKNDSRILRYYFNQLPKLIFQQTWCNLALINMFRSLKLNPENYDTQSWNIFGTNRGTFGRISMKRTDFMSMGGYNEQMLNMGNQDTDILFRSLNQKFQYLVSVPRSDGSAKSSIINQSDIQSKQLRHNREITQKTFKNKQFVVNRDGFSEKLEDYELIGSQTDAFIVEETLVTADNDNHTENYCDDVCPDCGNTH
jgi:hypothetical protein